MNGIGPQTLVFPIYIFAFEGCYFDMQLIGIFFMLIKATRSS